MRGVGFITGRVGAACSSGSRRVELRSLDRMPLVDGRRIRDIARLGKVTPINRLIRIMAALRDPTKGCPWDREQDFASIAPYTIEEAYEVADAIAANDMQWLREELGDLLFQVVFHARMAEEQGAFDFDDVATAISDKMQRRHPHVFGDERIASAEEQSRAWEAHKRAERAASHCIWDAHCACRRCGSTDTRGCVHIRYVHARVEGVDAPLRSLSAIIVKW